MPTVSAMEARRAINGREGKVFQGTTFLGWVESIEARVVIDRQDIVRSGSHTTGYKPIGSTGTGTLNGFHITSYWRKLIADYTRNAKMVQPCQITIELSDPDQFGFDDSDPAATKGIERCVLKNVYFWEAPLGFDTGDTVKDDIPFTFEEAEFTDTITDAATDPTEIEVSEGVAFTSVIT